MTDVMGVPVLGKELKNIAELAVFNGMPTEHANRTVCNLHNTTPIRILHLLVIM